MGSPLLDVRGLVAAYGGRDRTPALPVLGDVDLAVEAGEFFTLLGESGCGKTTLLRCVAGLHRPDAGTIAIGGTIVHDTAAGIDVPADRRRLGMVFQSHAVWPHLDVAANVAFPLQAVGRRRRRSSEEIRRRVDEVLELVGLAGLRDRPASRLSGGQQQRLALARSVIAEPDLLLLDEPLSNLDAPLRAAMRFELRRLQRELGLTVLFVTHDQEEALAMSSRVAVMAGGRFLQVGPPEAIYRRPDDLAVATFVGRANLLPVRGGPEGEAGDVVTDLGPLGVGSSAGAPDGPMVAMVRPEDVTLSVEAPADGGGWPGRVVDVGFRGPVTDVMVDVDGVTLEVRSTPTALAPLDPGTGVWVQIPRSAVRLLPDQRRGS